MKKIKLLCMLCVLLIAANTTAISYGSPENPVAVDWESVYYDFAKTALENPSDKSHPLNGAISGLIMIDFNQDDVPELLTFSTTEHHYDDNGDVIYAFDEDYDSPAWIDYTHTIVNAFYINDDGKVTEDSPWRDGNTLNYPFIMPYLPDKSAGMETEGFCSGILKNNDEDSAVYLSAYTAPSLYEISFDGEKFKYTVSDFSEVINDFNDSVKSTDITVVSWSFYNDVYVVKFSLTDVMVALCDKYEAFSDPLWSFEYMSLWAQEEVRSAVNNVLVPDEMRDDDLSQNITRAEFASISFMLDRKMNGEVITDSETVFRTDFEGHEYEDYIFKSYNAGITRGTSEPTDELDIIFSPDENITREQMAVMLGRIIKKDMYASEWTPATDDIIVLPSERFKIFKDDLQISDYAKDSVYYMSEAGIIKGTDDVHFSPQELATREQALAMAIRIWNDFLVRME